jgi:hypothetical protein
MPHDLFLHKEFPVPAPALLPAATCISVVLPPGLFDPLFAYGPAPGMEFIPYFLGLLAWVGLAVGSFLLWPITAFLRRLRRGKNVPPAEPTTHPPDAPPPAGFPE